MMNSFEIGKLADVENHLKCPLCLKTFSSPRILIGCGHTFCMSCLEIKFSKRNECPICKCSARTTDVVSSLALDAIVSAYRRFACRTKNAQFIEGSPIDIASSESNDVINLSEAINVPISNDFHLNLDMPTTSEKVTTIEIQKEVVEDKVADCEEDLWNSIEVPSHRRGSFRRSFETFECVVRKPRSYKPVDIRTFTVDVRSSSKAPEEFDGANAFLGTKTALNNTGKCNSSEDYGYKIRTLPISGSSSSSSSSRNYSSSSSVIAHPNSIPKILLSRLHGSEFEIVPARFNMKQNITTHQPAEELDKIYNTCDFQAEGIDTEIDTGISIVKQSESDPIEVLSSASCLDNGKLTNRTVGASDVDRIEEDAETDVKGEPYDSPRYPSALCRNTSIIGEKKEAVFFNATQETCLDQAEPDTGTYSLYRGCDSLCDSSEEKGEITPLNVDTSTRYTPQRLYSPQLPLPRSCDLRESSTRWTGRHGQEEAEGEREMGREGKAVDIATSERGSGSSSSSSSSGSGSTSASYKHADDADVGVSLEERERVGTAVPEQLVAPVAAFTVSSDPIFHVTDLCTGSALDTHTDTDTDINTDTVGGDAVECLDPVMDDGCDDCGNMDIYGGGCDGSDDTYFESCEAVPSSLRCNIADATATTAATTTTAAATALTHPHCPQGISSDSTEAIYSTIRMSSQESNDSRSFCNVTLTSQWSQNEESFAEGSSSSSSCTDIVDKVAPSSLILF